MLIGRYYLTLDERPPPPHTQACFPPTSPPTAEKGTLYQSQAHTGSGNDAELIAFNPDAADNLEASSLRQRRAKSMQKRERGKQEDRIGDRTIQTGEERKTEKEGIS